MSSSIRPPGAPPVGTTGPSSIGDLKPEQAGGAQGVRAQDAAQAKPATETPTSQWLRRLEAGEVTKAQAVEGLVAQAVDAHGGARLSASQRAELADVLREALLGDPVLGELLGG